MTSKEYNEQFSEEELSNEIWKDVLGYEGLYQVSNLGRIKSESRSIVRMVNKNGLSANLLIKEKILKPHIKENESLRILLYKNGQTKTFRLNLLIYKAFFNKEISNSFIIFNKDGNFLNNKIDNLDEISRASFIRLFDQKRQESLKSAWKKRSRIVTEETKEKISRSLTGRKHTEEEKRKISESNKGKVVSIETKEKIRSALKIANRKEEVKKKRREAALGKHPSEETRKKMSIITSAKKGNLASNWRGGKNQQKYSLDWHDSLRNKIRIRDSFKCCLCGIELKKRLNVHHIDGNRENSRFDNLISLCYKCHGLSHRKKDIEFFKFLHRLYLAKYYNYLYLHFSSQRG